MTRRIRLTYAVATLLGAGLAFPARGHAQSAPAADRDHSEPPVCLGFSFGAWSPPLDWERAGHGAPVDSAKVPRAPGGRAWAAPSPVTAAADTGLVLFPTWWPVGIVVQLSTRAPAPGDTVSGQAWALVADGRQQVPTARVRAWRVRCGGKAGAPR